MWDDKTQYQKAEWLALKVLLGFKRPIVDMYWEFPSGMKILDSLLMEYINSPDGFFTVWDGMQRKLNEFKLCAADKVEFWEMFGDVFAYDNEVRYEEFYESIYHCVVRHEEG